MPEDLRRRSDQLQGPDGRSFERKEGVFAYQVDPWTSAHMEEADQLALKLGALDKHIGEMTQHIEEIRKMALVAAVKRVTR